LVLTNQLRLGPVPSCKSTQGPSSARIERPARDTGPSINFHSPSRALHPLCVANLHLLAHPARSNARVRSVAHQARSSGGMIVQNGSQTPATRIQDADQGLAHPLVDERFRASSLIDCTLTGRGSSCATVWDRACIGAGRQRMLTSNTWLPLCLRWTPLVNYIEGGLQGGSRRKRDCKRAVSPSLRSWWLLTGLCWAVDGTAASKTDHPSCTARHVLVCDVCCVCRSLCRAALVCSHTAADFVSCKLWAVRSPASFCVFPLSEFLQPDCGNVRWCNAVYNFVTLSPLCW
jgi:hypothetical protein